MLVLLRTAKLSAAFRLSAGQTRTFGVLSSFDIARKCRKTSPVVTYSIEPALLVETPIGNASPWSLAKMRKENPIALRLLVHLTHVGLNRWCDTAFMKTANNTPITATTTNTSTRVSALNCLLVQMARMCWNES